MQFFAPDAGISYLNDRLTSFVTWHPHHLLRHPKCENFAKTDDTTRFTNEAFLI